MNYMYKILYLVALFVPSCNHTQMMTKGRLRSIIPEYLRREEMKKVLFTVAALGLAAGIATSASALELKVKGDYTVDGFYIDNAAGAAAYDGDGGQGLQLASDYTSPLLADVETNSDAWLQHMFNIEAEMIVNDKISMMSRVRLVDWGSVWGAQDDTDVNNGHNMSIERLYMVYKSPVGIWEIGRRPNGAWGIPFIDSAGNGDRIFWKSGKLFGETFSTYAFYEKQYEGEAYVGSAGDSSVLGDDDMDQDYYEVAGALKGGWGSATLAYGLQFDNRAYETFDTTKNRIKGVGQFKIGSNMGFDTEFDYVFGDKDYVSNATPDQDVDVFAFIADFNATFDALAGHAMYFHISGDDDTSRGSDIESYGGTGSDFEPLYILTGVFGNILNQDQGPSQFGTPARNAGADAMVLTADYAVSQDLTLHAGFGYAVAAAELPGYDNDYGFEYNAGAAYKLVDNLVYAVHLGYLDTGDFFKLGRTYKDTNSIVLASHHLTMSF